MRGLLLFENKLDVIFSDFQTNISIFYIISYNEKTTGYVKVFNKTVEGEN